MIVFLNGRFLPEQEATVSVFDRGFLYGDGLFETVCVRNSRLFRWQQHLDRLEQGARFLQLDLPFTRDQLTEFASELVRRNEIPDALLRLNISRGVGPRGYSPKGSNSPVTVITVHPFSPTDPPPLWNLVTSSFVLPADQPLSQFKTANKLPQVLARAEADATGADEALLLNTNGILADATTSNLFWIEGQTLSTPALPHGALAGVTRAVLFELAPQLDLATQESSITPETLRQTDGVFLSLSSLGIVEAISLDQHKLNRSPVVLSLQKAYAALLNKETAD